MLIWPPRQAHNNLDAKRPQPSPIGFRIAKKFGKISGLPKAAAPVRLFRLLPQILKRPPSRPLFDVAVAQQNFSKLVALALYGCLI
jgi:hypothetical protein